MTTLQFQNTILDWYKDNKRDLLWRNTKDPYRILVSEVMLQQTQVSRVREKYGEFLTSFPTLEKLAAAPERKLLNVWRGLGYWKRAVNLKKSANIIVKEHGGKVPREPKELEKLPGIGPYTAKAVACFAFQNKDAFIDTNIRRVYLHFFFPKRKKVSDKEILKAAEKNLLTKDPARWHSALFDYGALVLKDRAINKRSRHYAKQSKFAGSLRFYRTKVMRYLLDQPNQKATLAKIQKLLRETGSPYPTDRILTSLVKDELVKKKRNSYSL